MVLARVAGEDVAKLQEGSIKHAFNTILGHDRVGEMCTYHPWRKMETTHRRRDRFFRRDIGIPFHIGIRMRRLILILYRTAASSTPFALFEGQIRGKIRLSDAMLLLSRHG